MSTFKKRIKNLPDSPGVYFFKRGKTILYIGKATSLRDRVKSYMNGDLMETRGPLLVKMMDEADDIDWEETDSVLEALVLEANLIKKFQPLYNTREKDHKSFNYVVISKEEYPRVFTARERELQTVIDPDEIRYQFGPYTDAGSLREALRIVRKIFPFRGKKDPIQPGKRKSRLRQQIGLAPDLEETNKKEYRKTIQHIRLFFEGKKKKLKKELEKEMKDYAKEKEFEKAERVKRQIFALEHINDVALIKPDTVESEYMKNGSFRIESYDIAHISGSDMVGVMVVIENGFAQKSEYRKFKIKSVDTANDTAGLAEVLKRRLNHDEWRLPKLIVVDGGKPQINSAKKTLGEFGYMIPVVSVVKDSKHRPKGVLGKSEYSRKYETEILLANSEAHRFAQSYHSQLRKKRMRE